MGGRVYSRPKEFRVVEEETCKFGERAELKSLPKRGGAIQDLVSQPSHSSSSWCNNVQTEGSASAGLLSSHLFAAT